MKPKYNCQCGGKPVLLKHYKLVGFVGYECEDCGRRAGYYTTQEYAVIGWDEMQTRVAKARE